MNKPMHNDIDSAKERAEHRRTLSVGSLYRWLIIVFLCVLVILFVVTYVAFSSEGPLPAGAGLDKSDWLLFFGSFMAFAGTVFVGMIAMLQNHVYVGKDDCRRRIERERLIRPVLVVSIEGHNRDFLVMTGLLTKTKVVYPESSTLRIANEGAYPIRNVIVMGRYVRESVAPGDGFAVTCGYGEVPELVSGRRNVMRVSEESFARSAEGLPETVEVGYEDVDGGEWRQVFKLRRFADDLYFGLDRIIPR